MLAALPAKAASFRSSSSYLVGQVSRVISALPAHGIKITATGDT